MSFSFFSVLSFCPPKNVLNTKIYSFQAKTKRSNLYLGDIRNMEGASSKTI